MGDSLTAVRQSHWAPLTGLLPGQETGEGGRSSGLHVNQLWVWAAGNGGALAHQGSPGLTYLFPSASPPSLALPGTCNPDGW